MRRHTRKERTAALHSRHSRASGSVCVCVCVYHWCVAILGIDGGDIGSLLLVLPSVHRGVYRLPCGSENRISRIRHFQSRTSDGLGKFKSGSAPIGTVIRYGRERERKREGAGGNNSGLGLMIRWDCPGSSRFLFRIDLGAWTFQNIFP